MTLHFATCDVFTADRYSGNPLAVVYGADDLSDAAMQRIAGEFSLSETIFVQTPDDAAHTAKVRIFTPLSEMPFAGHPTIGCAILLAEDAAGSGDFETIVTLEEVAGLVPVTVRRTGARIEATLTAPITPYALPAPITADDAAEALGLDAAAIGFGAHGLGLAEGGPRFAYVPVHDLAALGRAAPSGTFAAIVARCGTDNLYVYTPGENGADYRTRMFAPVDGILEDPATGSATALLAAHLDACGVLTDGTTDLLLHQGFEMGRPSHLSLGIDRAEGALTAVRVGGSAVRVMAGTLTPPAP